MEEAVDTLISAESARQLPSQSRICCPVSHVQCSLEEPTPTLAVSYVQSLLCQAHIHAFQFVFASEHHFLFTLMLKSVLIFLLYFTGIYTFFF